MPRHTGLNIIDVPYSPRSSHGIYPPQLFNKLPLGFLTEQPPKRVRTNPSANPLFSPLSTVFQGEPPPGERFRCLYFTFPEVSPNPSAAAEHPCNGRKGSTEKRTRLILYLPSHTTILFTYTYGKPEAKTVIAIGI